MFYLTWAFQNAGTQSVVGTYDAIEELWIVLLQQRSKLYSLEFRHQDDVHRKYDGKQIHYYITESSKLYGKGKIK